MPHVVDVPLGDRAYRIHIGGGLIDSIGDLIAPATRARQAMLVVDESVATPWAERIAARMNASGFRTLTTVLPEGETSKSSDTIVRLWAALAEAGFARDSMVVAIGGGVVGDAAGFAAASYLRGVDFVQVPTTLLAMVDSSVGGKTGINLPQGKNLVGAFWQPRLVVADLDVLSTLPPRQLASGMAEVVKYGVIRDAELFAFLERKAATLFDAGAVEDLAHVVRRSVEIKGDVVCADETETGVRRILNFGHTLGHAIEAELHYGTLTHGEAVSIGMVAASLLGLRYRAASWSNESHARLVRLLEAIGLPTRMPEGLTAEGLLARTRHDKKVKSGTVRYVLPVTMGEVEVTGEVTDDAVLAAAASLGAAKGVSNAAV